MIAIHKSNSGFHQEWISYCDQQGFPYKIVDCYANDLITQVQDCDALFWHYSQGSGKDILIAKQILFALEHSGFKVFPNFHTSWHFDDKVGQKYLLEATGVPLVPSYVFVDRKQALKWIMTTTFPKVSKLRGGAGSANVALVPNREAAKKIINKAFGRGFSLYNGWDNLRDRWYKYRNGKTDLKDVIKGIIRLGYQPNFSKINGREVGYAYFQDFIPNNDHDIRVIIIDGKAFAIKRLVRNNDFRASGSGEIRYDRDLFDIDTIRLAFDVAEKLQVQCIAFDFVYHNQQPLIIEISYGFSVAGYHDCPGYWDRDLKWYDGPFNPYGWMVNHLMDS